jgi:VanZ family protein
MMGVRIDYVVHFLLFFPVPLLIRKNTNQRIELMNILILAASIAIEGFHLVIPGRSFNPYDALANVSGAVAGMIASWLLDSIRHRS